MTNSYDVIIIGGGSAGFSVLEQISNLGLKIAMVENRKLGGSCPNFACVPTKILVKSAEVLKTAQDAMRFGVRVKDVGFDGLKIQKLREEKIAGSEAAASKEDLVKKKTDLLWGTAKFISPQEIEVDRKVYKANKFVITTGSRANIPPIKGLRETGFLISDQAVELKTLPQSLAVLGSGPVGIELSQIFARFGVRVAIISRGKQILNREEPKVSELVQKYLEEDGVEFINSATVKSVSRKGKLKHLEIEIEGKMGHLEVQEILVATGRAPNIENLDLERAGVEFDQKGVKVNEYMQTTNPNIFAAGDVAGIMLFTHAASYEGYILGQNLLGQKVKADHRVVPRGVFCDPEVGSVGIMEKEAKEKRHQVLTAVMDYGGGRTFTSSEPWGLIKVTVDKKTRQILGASMVGKNAAEVVHILALAMHAQISVDKMDTMVYAFPTYAEGLAGITDFLK